MGPEQGTTTPGQSITRNEGVLHYPHTSRTRALLPDAVKCHI